MIAKAPPRLKPPRRRQALHTWQRLILAGTLAVAIALSAALIYFQPGTHTLLYREPAPATPLPGTAPALPPGTDTYYYWGQSKPLSQQP
jgi:hypothetical protein